MSNTLQKTMLLKVNALFMFQMHTNQLQFQCWQSLVTTAFFQVVNFFLIWLHLTGEILLVFKSIKIQGTPKAVSVIFIIYCGHPYLEQNKLQDSIRQSVSPVNLAKFLRTPFLQNKTGRLILNQLPPCTPTRHLNYWCTSPPLLPLLKGLLKTLRSMLIFDENNFLCIACGEWLIIDKLHYLQRGVSFPKSFNKMRAGF